uniref:Uncharacterized protein n=1 Tax=Panagrolaimus sp. JU765 TaxID=591449 RepID=A0AC34RIW4_9BILA
MADNTTVNAENQSPHVVIITRSPESHYFRRRESSSLIAEQVMFPETDTFCLLPTRMRCLCILLTILLIISLGAAIGNSIQSAGFKSTSFCKTSSDDFDLDLICPKESMFYYFECCPETTQTEKERLVCCAQFKMWLVIAMLSVFLSFTVGIIYTVLRYIVKCF